MTISLTHPFVSSVSDDSTPTIVRPVNWNAEHVLTMTGPALLGRSTASTGSAEELSLGGYLAFSGSTIKVSSYTYPTNYQLFTSNGTWTKPTGTSFVYVRICGGGTGGRGGYSLQGNMGTGGAGGVLVQTFIVAATLGSTVSVVVGSGGTGGTVDFGGSEGGSSSFGTYYSGGASSYHGYGGAPPGIFTGIINGKGTVRSFLSPTEYNCPLAPAAGGNGAYEIDTGSGVEYYGATRSGVGFANLIAAPIQTAQSGSNAALYGTGLNTNASAKGYGGGGSDITNADGGSGYLGGGGGGGCSYISPTSTTSKGGNGGNGFVEVFSW